MFALYMNDMRGSKFEELTLVQRAATEQELRDLIERERVPVYKEERANGFWGKSFRKDGPLEWFNIMTALIVEEPSIIVETVGETTS